MKVTEPVILFCKSCKQEDRSHLEVRGVDDTIKVEYYTECSKCDNWELGDLPFQGFDIVKHMS